MSDSAPPPAKRLGLGVILAFSGPGLVIAGLGYIYGVYIGPYFTGVLGVPLTVISGAFLLTQILTFGLDPLLGWAMDRTRTPIGRFRPWLLAGVPVFALAVHQIFMASKGIGFTYLVGWGLVMALGTSMLVLSQSAWGANLAANYNDRSRLYGIAGGVAGAGAICFLLIQIVMAQPHPGLPNNIQMSGWIIIALVPLAVGLLALVVREPISPSARTPFALKDYWEMIARPEMLRLIAADFALALGPGTTAPLYLFFFRDVLGFSAGQEGVLLLIYTVAAIFGGPTLGWLATRFGKHRTLAVSTVGYAICQTGIVFVPKGLFPVAAVAMFGCGFIAAAFILLVRAMVADVGDEVRLEQGKERMSLLYALVTTTTKIGGAITLPITYTVLGIVGFKTAPGAANTPAAIHGLVMCYVFAPVIFVLAGGLAMIGYKLDAKRHAAVRAKLELRDAALGAEGLTELMSGTLASPPAAAEQRS
jgi:GPH family glycoside/pentoside/hexuronide:cation symporter